jgi:tetratricopeptide (TPR) repeat protein
MMVLTILMVVVEVRYESALKHLTQAKVLAESNATQDGRVWYMEAERIADGAARFNPLDARLLIQAGDANAGLAIIETDEATRLLYFEAAEMEYLEALRLQPDNHEIYQRLADVYLRTNRLAKAADAIRIARELNPLDVAVTVSLEERVRALGGL